MTAPTDTQHGHSSEQIEQSLPDRPTPKPAPPMPAPFSDEQKATIQAKEKKPNHPAVAGPRTRRSLTWMRRPWRLTDAEREAAVNTWVNLGGDAAALAHVQDRAPDVLAALLEGAAIPGNQGSSDRAIFLRLIGLGHLTRAAAPTLAESDARINVLGDRLAVALMARAGASGQISVKRGLVIDGAPLGHSDFVGLTHKRDDLVSEATADIEAFVTPATVRPTLPDPPAAAGPDRLDTIDWG